MPRFLINPLALRSALRLPVLFGVALCGALLLSGCGNKGPLYLPPDAPITEVGVDGNDTSDDQSREQTDEAEQ